MKKFQIKKEVNGQEVIFNITVHEKVDQYGELEIKCEYNGNAIVIDKYLEYKKVLLFMSPKNICGKKVDGISLPKEVAEEIEEIYQKAIKERKKIEQEKFENELEYSLYYGDWYRPIGFFIEVDNKSIPISDRVNSYIKQKFPLIRLGYETAQKDIESFFKLDLTNSKEDIEKKVKLIEKYNLKSEVEERDGIFYISYIKGALKNWDKIFKEVYEPKVKRIEEKNKQQKKEIEEALKKAKETGKKVLIKCIGGYDGDTWNDVKIFGTKEIIREYRNSGGLGWVNIYLVACPDGTVKEEHYPSY